MATRAMIIINEGEKLRGIYSHHDGYPAYLGSKLLNHYNSFEKAKELIELGDISIIDDSIETTIAYHRDRGEKLQITSDLHISGFEKFDYTYLFEDGAWKYRSNDRPFIPLTLVYSGINSADTARSGE